MFTPKKLFQVILMIRVGQTATNLPGIFQNI